jgi:high-affinity iron transporter
MLPAFLITLREVLEASLIVATIFGILIKLNQKNSIKTVWMATAAAGSFCIFLLAVSSLFGLEIQKLYVGKIEQATEGGLLIISAVFITWAVFFLHKYFSSYKVKLLQKVRNTLEKEEQKGLFILVFTAVFREGFEVVLFLTTIYFSSTPFQIFGGFSGGFIAGILLSFAFFSAAIKLPIFYAFKVTSGLLILFAGGMVAKGAHEFVEFGLIPETAHISLPLVPNNTVMAHMIESVFGISKHMDITQLTLYTLYILFMTWWVFFRKKVAIIENG